jgi:methylthioribose-1-phosphate isomerase
MDDCAEAIRNMTVRGAPLIGATAAYGMCLALRDDPSDAILAAAYAALFKRAHRDQFEMGARPDAGRRRAIPPAKRLAAAYARAAELVRRGCRGLRSHRSPRSRNFPRNSGEERSVGDRSSTSSPIATPAGSRASIGAPRSRRFSWPTMPGCPSMSGSMKRGPATRARRSPPGNSTSTACRTPSSSTTRAAISCSTGWSISCIVGTDRTTAQGDVANKIGTYLKALAARDNGVPFYVALPSSTIDWTIRDGLKEIPIEERKRPKSPTCAAKRPTARWPKSRSRPTARPPCNYGFDVTPARLVTGAHHREGRLRRQRSRA